MKNMASVNTAVDMNRSRASIEGVNEQELPDQLNTLFFSTRFESHYFSAEQMQLKESLLPKRSPYFSLHRPTFCIFSLENAHCYPCSEKVHPKTTHCSPPCRPDITCDKNAGKDCEVIHYICCSAHASSITACLQCRKGVDVKMFISDQLMYKHLEMPQSHARLLFADFSFAFNTMQPHILAQKLISNFIFQHDLVLLIVDFRKKQMSTGVCEHDVLSVSRHSYWIPPGVCSCSFPLPSVYRRPPQ